MEQITSYLDELHSSSFISIKVPTKLGIKFYYFSICGNHHYITITPKFIKNQLINFEVSFGKLHIGHSDIFEDVKNFIGGINEPEYYQYKKRGKLYDEWDSEIKENVIYLFSKLYPKQTSC